MEDRMSRAASAANEKKARKGKRRKRILRKIVLLLLVLALLGGLGWWGLNRLQAEYTVTYQEYTATMGTISNSLSFSGTLQAINNKTYTAMFPRLPAPWLTIPPSLMWTWRAAFIPVCR